MTSTQTRSINRIALRAGKKGARPGLGVRKISYRAQTQTKTTKMQTNNTDSDI